MTGETDMGRWNEKEPKTSVQELSKLVGYVQVDLGFCDAPSAHGLLDKYSRLTGKIFAREVLEAEGMADTLTNWPRDLERLFVARFGDHLENDT